ncbi:hypothetical protein D3C73_1332640 [compost metagenome]
MAEFRQLVTATSTTMLMMPGAQGMFIALSTAWYEPWARPGAFHGIRHTTTNIEPR